MGPIPASQLRIWDCLEETLLEGDLRAPGHTLGFCFCGWFPK